MSSVEKKTGKIYILTIEVKNDMFLAYLLLIINSGVCDSISVMCVANALIIIQKMMFTLLDVKHPLLFHAMG